MGSIVNGEIQTHKFGQDYFNEYLVARRMFGTYESKILDRIDYIVRTIAKSYGTNLKGWWFHDAPEGGMGTFQPDRNQIGDIYWDIKGDGGYDKALCVIDGATWSLWDSFPTRWLWEDFEQELLSGKKKAEKKAKKRK